MLYDKDKHLSFQAAQQGVKEAQDVYESMITESPDYGRQLKHLKQEVNEAYQQVDKALAQAGENQREQLIKYASVLEQILEEINGD